MPAVDNANVTNEFEERKVSARLIFNSDIFKTWNRFFIFWEVDDFSNVIYIYFITGNLGFY